ncbi:MAG TPA: preprotein translocase subunit SecE [Acidimicrobiales bacterium]
MNRETKRRLQRQGQLGPEGEAAAPVKRQPTPRPAPKQGGRRTGAVQVLREVRGELRKVAWPTRSEVVNYAVIVLFALILLIGLIFLLDLAFAKSVLFLFES